MVDLVKIRKKAKEKAESQTPRTPEPAVKKGSGVGARGSEEVGSEAPQATPAQVDSQKTSPKAAKAEKRTQAAAKQQPAAPIAAEPAQTEPTPSEPRPPSPDPSAKSSKLERFKEQAGKRREEADSIGRTAAEEGATVDGQLEVLTFAIAGENYAIEIENIVEIVPPRAATRVPNAAASIVGIISLRGTIVTLLDARRRLKHAESPETPDTRIIVLEHESETVGFEVDRVFRVVKISAAEVAPHPVVHASEQDESIRGVFRHGESLTILLDFAKLLGSREVARTGPREALALGSRR